MNSYFDPIFPALLISIALFTWWWTSDKRRARWVLLSLIAIAWVYASPWPSLAAARFLQEAYAPGDASPTADEAVAIVVLSGDGVTPNRYQERTLLGEHTLVRLEKAYDLAIERPALRVIVTGGLLFGADPSITLAGMMRSWLIERAVPADRIVGDGASTNTYESARTVASLVCSKGESIFLVTEALHMPASRWNRPCNCCAPGGRIRRAWPHFLRRRSASGSTVREGRRGKASEWSLIAYSRIRSPERAAFSR